MSLVDIEVGRTYPKMTIERPHIPRSALIDTRSQSPMKYITATPPRYARSFDRNATIVLVGARGSGKRSLGFIGATHLGRRLITEDHYFEETTGLSRKSYLSKYGVRDFQMRIVQIVRQMLLLPEHQMGCIIECGMSSLARGTQETLREYAATHPVIYIIRSPDRVRKLLKLSPPEASRLLQADMVHRSFSNFEYYNLHDDGCEGDGTTDHDRASPHYSSGLQHAKQDFSNFLDFITGVGVLRSAFESQFTLAAIAPEYRPFTYALNVRLSTLLRQGVRLDLLDIAGGDVVELRVDVVVPDMFAVLDKQIALLRRRLVGVPVIFKVESALSNDSNQGAALYRHALRMGVEYLSVDLQFPDSLFVELNELKGGTKIIGQYLNTQQFSTAWADGTMTSMFQRAQLLGCELARLLRVAVSDQDNDDCLRFSESITAHNSPTSGYSSPANYAQPRSRTPHLIAYNIGTLGQRSQVFNKIFTPVTHTAAIPPSVGEQDFLLTAQQAMQALFQAQVLSPLRLYITGAAVQHSLSPAMHNAAYATCGLSHSMIPMQCTTLDELHKASQDPHFGGSGIAQPFKVGIMSHLTGQSHHATAIGAVNTLVPLRALPDGAAGFLQRQAAQRNKAGTVVGWYGDNTDWQGILTCLRRNLSPRNVVQPSRTTGLVIGAGGMARASIYAMIQLGCRKIFIHNRTTLHAEAVAAHFNSWAAALSITGDGEVVSILRSRTDTWPVNHNLPTLIVSCIPTHKVGSAPSPEFDMPVSWLQSPTGGVFLELAYRPKVTPLLRQFASLRKSGTISTAWVTVDGEEFIPEQGIAQFELMTGRKAPKGVMKKDIADRLNAQERSYGLKNQIDHINEVAEESWSGVDAI